MIFHNLHPIVEEGLSGSKVRPLRMLEAFRQLGYQVEVVAGYVSERKQAIRRVEQEMQRGRQFDFVYSESSTRPTLLTAQGWYRNRPCVDFGFLRWLGSQSVPVGLYYRDVYWRFAHYRAQVSWRKRVVFIPLYWYDWMQYRRLVDHLFLPAWGMKDALPTAWPVERMGALPPGCNISNLPERPVAQASSRLDLFYVGGIVPPLYDLKPMFDAVRTLEHVSLTLCCRAFEWEKMQSYYAPLDSANKVHIVHAHGKELDAHYATADLFCLIRSSNPYLDFAMPVKVFEALEHGVPIVTIAGTESARFVAQEDIGWVVSTMDELRKLLEHLKANPHLIAEKRKRVRAVRERHTWQVRAQTVADVLMSS